MRVRARVRAETTHVPHYIQKNDKRQVLMMYLFWRSARARLYDARQLIFPRKEISLK